MTHKRWRGLPKRKRGKAGKVAARMPNWVRDIASSKARRARERGTFGAASPVRVIRRDGQDMDEAAGEIDRGE
jgi:hypothetical protein